MWLKFVQSAHQNAVKTEQASQSASESEREDFVRIDSNTYKTHAWSRWFTCSYFRPSLARSFLPFTSTMTMTMTTPSRMATWWRWWQLRRTLQTKKQTREETEIRNGCHGWCLKSIWNWKFIFHRTKTNKSRMHAWIYSLLRVYTVKHAYIHTDQAEQSAAKALIVLGAFKSFAMREIYLIPTVQFTLVTIACVLSLSITSIRTHKLPMHTYFIPLKSRIP